MFSGAISSSSVALTLPELVIVNLLRVRALVKEEKREYRISMSHGT